MIGSNLYALETMSTITGDLEAYYQDQIDTFNVYLKNNQTDYSTQVSALNSEISKY